MLFYDGGGYDLDIPASQITVLGFAVLCNEGEMDVTEMLWILYNAVLGYG